MKYFIYVILLGFASMSYAQSTCTIPRYINSKFTAQVSSNVATYAVANNWLGGSENLSFDFYQPAGDTLTKRPLIIMSFGGSFLGGSKTQAELVDYCTAMAERGFCVASIDYRIGFNVFSTSSSVRAVYRGLQDFKAAVRYFRANATTYGIDPSHVYGGGNSAGAINAIHAAYADESDRSAPLLAPTFSNPDLGCMNCVGTTFMIDSEPDGVVNLWGGIGLLGWIETATDDAPIISFHGDADNVVLPNTGSPFNFPIFPPLSGSIDVHARMNAIGLPSKLNVEPGGGHELWGDPVYANFIQVESAICMNNWMKPVAVAVNGPTTACLGGTYTYCSSSPVSSSKYCWNVTNGTIIGNNQGSCITVQWNTTGAGSITMSERTCLDVVGDPASTNVTISNSGPIANFGFTYTNNSIAFNNTSTGGVSYAWDFGDGSTSTAMNPTYTYPMNGNYTVTLTVTNAAGCASTFTTMVHQFCQSTLTLSTTSTATGLYQVYNWIMSNQPTVGGSNVDFKAGDYITLNGGFVTQQGDVFCATIVPCSN